MALAILLTRSACYSAPSVRRDGTLAEEKVPLRRRSRTLRSLLAGIGQGRVTDNLAQDIDLLDGALHIPDADTIRMIYHLLDRDGLYVGASTALNVVAAKKLAEKLGKGSRVVTILCDGAYRYVVVGSLEPCALSLPGSRDSLRMLITTYRPTPYRYQSRLFSKKWLESKELLKEIPEHLQKYVVLP